VHLGLTLDVVRWQVASLIVLVSAAAVAEAATVRGTIEHEGAPLPGVTVTLFDSHHSVGAVITNVDGRFEFASVDPGRLSLEATLEGLISIELDVTLSDADFDIGTHQMVLSSVSETITLSCGPRCDDIGEISCKEFELHRALEDEALNGDASQARNLTTPASRLRSRRNARSLAAPLL
jgi:hypothetical protein